MFVYEGIEIGRYEARIIQAFEQGKVNNAGYRNTTPQCSQSLYHLGIAERKDNTGQVHECDTCGECYDDRGEDSRYDNHRFS